MAFIKAAAIHRDMREQTLAFQSKSAVNNLNNSDSDWINSMGNAFENMRAARSSSNIWIQFTGGEKKNNVPPNANSFLFSWFVSISALLFTDTHPLWIALIQIFMRTIQLNQ